MAEQLSRLSAGLPADDGAREVAIVGIDGSGKSTLIRRLIEREQACGNDLVPVVHCPVYHQDPNAPLALLSRQCEAFSRAADALQSFELKAAALYLQMTLFGPVQQALLSTWQPQVLICERHALVDTLAYGPFYQRMVTKDLVPEQVEEPLRRELDAREPASLGPVLAWHAAENRRLGRDGTFWDLPKEICAQFNKPLVEQAEEFAARYRTSLPNTVIMLDVEPEEAQRRIALRDGDAAELHESVEHLSALRQSYLHILKHLSENSPVRVHVVPAGQGQSTEAVLQSVSEVAPASRAPE